MSSSDESPDEKAEGGEIVIEGKQRCKLTTVPSAQSASGFLSWLRRRQEEQDGSGPPATPDSTVLPPSCCLQPLSRAPDSQTGRSNSGL